MSNLILPTVRQTTRRAVRRAVRRSVWLTLACAPLLAVLGHGTVSDPSDTRPTRVPTSVTLPDEAFTAEAGAGLLDEGWAACRARVTDADLFGVPLIEANVAAWVAVTYPALSESQAIDVAVLSGKYLCPAAVIGNQTVLS